MDIRSKPGAAEQPLRHHQACADKREQLGIISRTIIPCILLLLAITGCGGGIRVAYPLPASINDSSVFLGDSITNFWDLPKYNAGISGQTSAQIEARFQTSVVQSGLPRVIILAGANDVRAAQPDFSGILANIQKMVAQGRAAGIEVVLCELTPITCCDTSVRRLNAMIKDYASTQNLILVDYHTPMAGRDAILLKDGIHPNALGYAIMEDTLTQAFRSVR